MANTVPNKRITDDMRTFIWLMIVAIITCWSVELTTSDVYTMDMLESETGWYVACEDEAEFQQVLEFVKQLRKAEMSIGR